MRRYNPKEIEPKWQKKWDEDQTYKADLNSSKPKYYAMSMLNYPSGSGIHIGHAMNYTISDVMARAKRQQGFESYHPIGWDAFGLPAENYAIKSGESPQKAMARIIPHYHKQYKAMGWSNDWSREVSTHEPEYYKWTQWIFTQMFKNGLAYQATRRQWWCSVDNTVLADEQVTPEGKCWRHDGPNDPPVERREVKQWFFKITDYADELLAAIDELDWSESVKLAQKNWIGKSEGALINFKLTGQDEDIQVFTTRPDTIYGATFLVLAPEHPILEKQKLSKEAQDYIEQAKRKTDLERQESKDKTGVNTGLKATNPASGEEIPVWIADYVTMGYGTGAIMAVPAHDQRDNDFAQKYKLPIRSVVSQEFGDPLPNAKDVTGPVVIGYNPKTKKFMSLLNAGTNQRWLVGGGLEDGETYEDAARRELAEEAGFKDIEALISLGDPTYSYYFNPNKQSNRRSFSPMFLAIMDSTKQGEQALESHENYTVDWTSLEAVIKDFEAEPSGRGHWLEGLRRVELAVKSYKNDERYLPAIYSGEGVLFNSGKYDGLSTSEAREKIVNDLAGFDSENPATIDYVTNPQTGEQELVFVDSGEGTPKADQPFEEREAVEVLVKHWAEDKYIGLKWKKIDWETIITGGIEEGQTAEEAAIAEIRQETGYQNPVLKKRFGKVHAKFYHGPKKVNRFAHFQVLYFELADGERAELSKEEQEIHEVVWLSRAEMDKFRLPDSQRYMWNQFNGRANIAQPFTNYRMRDWSVGRQRYWGAPIPIIHCPKCGTVAVPDEDLPVLLPALKNFEPNGDGRPALARATDWLKVKCPACGGEAERETDTMDTYVDSGWYFLRYLDPHNAKSAFDSKVINKWMPVDFYNGADHATAHMIYARFITRFFAKHGLVIDPEPFKKFLFNGKVVGSDGKMFSKSKGNGVDPLEIIASGYGADALRTYLMFAAPLDQWVRWDPQGVPGTFRFLSRLWNLTLEFLESSAEAGENEAILRSAHKTIRKVTEDIESQKYNTAIAAMMQCVNELYAQKTEAQFKGADSWRFALESLVQLVAPFAPHIAEELWHELGHEDSVNVGHWPIWDEKYVTDEVVTLAVQINGKVRAEIEVPLDIAEKQAIEQAKKSVEEHIKGKKVQKAIYVRGRLVSLVVG